MVPIFVSAQLTTVATYSAGDISTDDDNSIATSTNSGCTGTLTVNVPVGRYVTSVDVDYDMEALGFNFITNQWSYIECVGTSIKENTASQGAIFASGVQSYSRTGLNIANGVAPAGGVQFKMHAFRNFGFTGCTTTDQKVVNNSWTITVHHIAAPSCLPPSALQVTSTAANSANLSWTSGGATNWQIEYGPAGFTPGTGSIMQVSSNPFTLSGLNQNTSYDIRIQDSCGLADVSFWTPIVNFRTACSVATAPWTENFDGTDWVAPVGFGNSGTIDPCFSRNTNGNLVFVSGPPAFAPFNTGPSGDHTTGSAKYAFSELINFGGAAPFTAQLKTPSIDVSALTSPEMSFWYHMFGFSIGNLQVAVSANGGPFTAVKTITGQQQTAKTDAWLEDIVDLSTYANDTIIVRFRSNQTFFGTAGDLAIDDISIYEQPTCPKPNSLAFVSNTTTSITLDWTTGGATNWQVEYGPVGYANGTGTLLNATTNPFTMNGLLPSTAYDVYVRDSCGINDMSFWVGPIAMQTGCGVIAAPFVENFDSPLWDKGAFFNGIGTLDTCWDRTPIGTLFWKTGPAQFIGATGATVDHTTGSSAGKYMYTELNGFTPPGFIATVLSPSIDLAALSVPELSFWYHMFGGNMGDLSVSVSNDGGLSYSSVVSYLGEQQSSSADAWKEAIVNLSSYANDTIILKFEVDQPNFGFNGSACIDDVRIQEAPTCAKPSDLALDFIWFDNVTVSWTSGGASNWDIEYGPVGFTPGSGTRLNVTTNPTNIPGLSANTVYEIYVRDSCGLNDASIWVGPLKARTLCNPAGTPYSEDFSGSGFQPGVFFNDTGSIDVCWRRDNLSNMAWKGGPPNFSPFNTGPDVDHTDGTASGKYAFTQTIGFTTNNPRIASLWSQTVDVSALTNPQLSFWYHMFGPNITSLKVLITNNGTTFTQELVYNGQQQTSKADAWKEGIISLAGYTDTIQIEFRGEGSATGIAANMAIDDILIDEAPACPKPQSLQVITTSNSSITIDWIDGGASNWNIEYGATGFTPGSGTIINVTSHPHTITGLSANTGYAFYVRDSCALGGSSVWIGPAVDTTDCNPVNAPYLEDFESTVWTIGGFFTPGNIDPCWDRSPGAYIWTPGQNATQGFGTGPDMDHTTGSGKYLYSEFVFGATQNSRATVESILVDLSPLTTPELSFWYHMFGPDIDSLSVEVSNGTLWSTIWSIAGQQQTSSAALWKEIIVDLSAFANDTVKLRFTAVKTNGFGQQSDIAIDDVDIHEQPTCPQPSALTVTSATATSLTLNWTTGGATNWQVEYGAPGFTLGTGTLVNVTTNPFVLSGLNSSTTFDIYIRDSCSLTDQSTWFGPVIAATLCLPLTAPFTENFDGSNYIPSVTFNDTGIIANCWNRNLASYYWTPGPPLFAPFGTGPSGDHTTGTGQYMLTDLGIGFLAPPFQADLETPFIDLSSLNVPELSFWYHMFGGGIGTLEVEIDNGSGYTNLVTFSGQQHTSSTDPWKESIISLATYANDTVRIRFRGAMTALNFQSQNAIDDIDIHEAPSCPKPQNLVSTIVSTNSITLSWTTGGASNWQLEYGTPGFTPGTGTLLNATTNPFTINSLSANTAYDFYVRDSCSLTDQSAWFGPYADTTDCSLFTAPYTENFDAAEWIPSNGFDAGTISQCWDRNATNGYFWTSGQNGTQSFNTGPSSDHTTGTGKFVYTEGFNGVNTNITSPSIDISGLTSPELRFWYHMFGNNISEMKILINDGTSWFTQTTLSGQSQTSNGAAWKERIIDLSAYAGDTIKIRFRGTKTGFGQASDIALDDLWIGNSPTCTAPINLNATATTLNSISLTWTNGSASNWQIKYRVSGSTGPFTFVPTSTNPHILTGLNSSTNYEIYVQDSCGLGDVSFWNGPIFESTDCAVITAPWTESFDGGSWISGTGFTNTGNVIDQCWSRNTAITPQWGTRTGATQTFNTGPSGAHSGNNYIFRETSGGMSGTANINSPDIYIPSGINAPKLYFYYHMFGTGVTDLKISIDDGSGFTNVYTKAGAQQTSNAAAWIKDSVDLAGYSGDTIVIRLIGTNTGVFGDLAVDELSIVGTGPQCGDPTNLVTSNIAPNSVDLTWSSVNTGLSQVQFYDIAVGPPGTTISNVSSPYTLSNLQANTTYVINVYDSCSASSQSASISDTILTDPCPIVTAGFNFTRSVLNVNFNSTSANADSLLWNFDGTSTSNASSPSFLYSAPGTYNVSLIAFNFCGTSDTMIIPIQVCDSLIPNYTFSKNLDTVAFDASASQGAISYEWDFGNGADSTGMQLSYLYPNSGNYIVRLKVKNACGDSAVFVDTVSICLSPKADWTYTIISSGGGGMQVQFDGTNSQNAVQYNWDFGDGNTNTTQSQPIHTYIVPSLLYQVTLTVTNGCNESNTKSYRLNEIGITEFFTEDKVDIYPNPADDRTFVEWNENTLIPTQAEIYDLSGKLLKRVDISSTQKSNGKMELNTARFADGVYIIRLIGPDLDLRQEFLVQH